MKVFLIGFAGYCKGLEKNLIFPTKAKYWLALTLKRKEQSQLPYSNFLSMRNNLFKTKARLDKN